jgi:hypothetical protein
LDSAARWASGMASQRRAATSTDATAFSHGDFTEKSK